MSCSSRTGVTPFLDLLRAGTDDRLTSEEWHQLRLDAAAARGVDALSMSPAPHGEAADALMRLRDDLLFVRPGDTLIHREIWRTFPDALAAVTDPATTVTRGTVDTVAYMARQGATEAVHRARLAVQRKRAGGKRGPDMTRDSEEFTAFAARFLNGTPMDDRKADAMAEALHAGQTDQTGDPYINHPRGVRDLLVASDAYATLSPTEQDDARVVALLHDTVEDTALTADDLAAAGCTPGQVAAIVALTKVKGESNDAYYARILATGPVTVTAKADGDLAHNNLPQRRALLPGSPTNPVDDPTKDTYTRLGRKYAKAYAALGRPVPEHLLPFVD